MTTQQSPYLRQQRDFPSDDIKSLAVQSDKAYVDTATAVNSRVIGTYGLNTAIVTGEQWYLDGQPQKQQTLRKLFQFTSSGSFPHGIDFSTITAFTRIYGTFTDGTNWYPIPYVDTAAFVNQMSVYVTPMNIVINAGAGVTISSGFIVLEYLSQF